MILLHRNSKTRARNDQHSKSLLQSRYRNRTFVISKHSHSKPSFRQSCSPLPPSPQSNILENSREQNLSFGNACKRLHNAKLFLAWCQWRKFTQIMSSCWKVLSKLLKILLGTYFFAWKLKSKGYFRDKKTIKILKVFQSQTLFKAWLKWMLFLKDHSKRLLLGKMIDRISHSSKVGTLWWAWRIWIHLPKQLPCLKYVRRKIGHCDCVYHLGRKNKQNDYHSHRKCNSNKHLMNRIKLLRYELEQSRLTEFDDEGKEDKKYRNKTNLFNTLEGQIIQRGAKYNNIQASKRLHSHW
mmetsp:Transcript_10152/g.12318  ORF Transcript_10152/g.12318 Transcript_10152/m.12318 type:complete len:296 (+) Transcript_10152:80-967(+)